MHKFCFVWCVCVCLCVCVREREREREKERVFKPGRPPVRWGYVQIGTNINDNNEKLSVTFLNFDVVVLYSKDVKWVYQEEEGNTTIH